MIIERLYEGDENSIADLSIFLYKMLEKWKSKHPEYFYEMKTGNTTLHLIIKKETYDGSKTNSPV